MTLLPETTAVIAILSPFLPYLYKAAKSGGEIILEEAAKSGGKAALEKVKSVWNYLKSKFSDDSQLEKTAGLMLENPADEDFILVFKKSLDKYLQKNPNALEELQKLLGGPNKIQEIIAEGHSKIKDAQQEMSQPGGKQTIKAKDFSEIERVNQKQ